MKYKNRTIKIFNSSYRILYVNDIKSENPDRTTMGETNFTSRTIKIRVLDGKGHPKHAVMFDSVAGGYGIHNGFEFAPGDTLVNYSNGGRGSGDYRLQGPLPRFDNPEEAGGDFSGPRTYLRYTGKNKKK